MPCGLTGERKEARDTKRVTGKRAQDEGSGKKSPKGAGEGGEAEKGWGWNRGGLCDWGVSGSLGHTTSPRRPSAVGEQWGRGDEPAQFGECSWTPVPRGLFANWTGYKCARRGGAKVTWQYV